MLWACITPERAEKTERIMRAVADGWPHAQIVVGEPPQDENPFIVWGQEWLTMRIVPDAHRVGRRFYHVDNGYWMPAKGSSHGFYRITYRGMSPVLMNTPDVERGQRYGGRQIKQWRKSGRHILLALPGLTFGRAIGLDVNHWLTTVKQQIKKYTDRPIIVRDKHSSTLLAAQLQNCWALVTHSSNVAVDAVLAGVPVFVQPTSPAAPVGCLDLMKLEYPATPERTFWWASLMCQQYTLQEIGNGTARHYLTQVAAQADYRPAATLSDNFRTSV